MTKIDDRRLQVKIARSYYDRQKTQAEIAERLGLSRQKVQRLLKKSRKDGVVDILINPAAGSFPEFELGLEERYGLKDVVVCKATDYEDHLMLFREMGEAAAEYFLGLVRSGDRIAITWGATILAMLDALYHRPPPDTKDVTVVQAFGSMGEATYPEHITALTQRMAAYLGARCVMLTAPMVTGNARACEAFYGDPVTSAVLDLARNATLIVFGLGGIDPEYTYSLDWSFTQTPSHPAMQKLGAVGETNLRFFDAKGRAVKTDIDEQVVGLTLDEIRGIDIALCMAGGVGKLEAIRAALESKLMNILITDHVTAQKLLAGETS